MGVLSRFRPTSLASALLVSALCFVLSGASGAILASGAPLSASAGAQLPIAVEASPLFEQSLVVATAKIESEPESPVPQIRVADDPDSRLNLASYTPQYTTYYTCSGGTCTSTCSGPTCIGSSTCIGTSTCSVTCGHTCYTTCDTTCVGRSTCAGTSTCIGTSTCSATCAHTCYTTCGTGYTCGTTCGTTCTSTCGTTCGTTCTSTCGTTCGTDCNPGDPDEPPAPDPVAPVLFVDGFESFPGPWQIGGSGGPGWGQASYRKSEGEYSAYCAGSEIDAPGPYGNDMDTWMTAGPFDLTAETEAKLYFDMWLDSERNYDWLRVGLSTDDVSYSMRGWSGDSEGWMTVEVDLADFRGDGSLSFAGEPEVWITFFFESDHSNTAEGAYVDHVMLTGTPAEDPADPIDTPPDDSAIRIEGTSRFDTAVAASQAAFPDGAYSVVIATGRNWPDALGGTALAGVLDAPILLVDTNGVPEVTMDEIVRLGASRAIILGGTAAAGAQMENELRDRLGAANVMRIAGNTRYATADAVALRVIAELGQAYDGTALLATGRTFADAVAVAPLAAARGWPLYLVHPSAGVLDSTAAAMNGVERLLVLGGTAAISSGVEASLGERFAVTRLAGVNRYGTASAIAAHGVSNAELAWNRVGIATGQRYPDALAGGVLQAKAGSVMLLTRSDVLSPETASAISTHKAEIGVVTVFGGTGAVSEAVRNEVAQILR